MITFVCFSVGQLNIAERQERGTSVYEETEQQPDNNDEHEQVDGHNIETVREKIVTIHFTPTRIRVQWKNILRLMMTIMVRLYMRANCL